MNVEAALAYTERNGLQALLIERDGDTLFERYAAGSSADSPHALYSGTKSFWGPLALDAQTDGLLELDEPVGATFLEWNVGAKSRVLLRDLLALTSGLPFGGLGNAVPPYAKALAVELKDEPRTRFTYGGIPLQVFGAVLARKLSARNTTPHAYLRERLLEPAGVTVARWRSLADGTQPLPTGAFVTTRDWARYGRRVLDEPRWRPCFEGTHANPRYGLGWWLSPLPAHPDVVYASGAGGQALYLIASARTVVVRFGNGKSYAHAAFLRRLLT
ncbi:MAG: serine hydrolase domain-containing protein [Candidatus Velthaea sp.]